MLVLSSFYQNLLIPLSDPKAPSNETVLLSNLTVRTLDEQDSISESIVLNGENIAAVGLASKLAGDFPKSIRINLPSNTTIFPGFVDAHAHIYGTGERVLRPRLEAARSVEDVQKIIAALTVQGSKDWIVARGWDQNQWPTKTFPTLHDLDGLTKTQPIALTRIDGHALWCNQIALDHSDISIEGEEIEGGEIVRDAKGNPTGILIDEAMKLTLEAIPAESEVETMRVIEAGLGVFATHGNGAVHDMGVTEPTWNALCKLYEAKGDTLPRGYIFLDLNQTGGKKFFDKILKLGFRNASPHERLQLVGVKIYLDGALGSRGANLFADYSDDSGNRGLALSNDKELIAQMAAAAKAGLQIAVHAIGDAAVARALRLFEASVANSTNAVLRIEHAQIVRDEDIAAFVRLGVTAVVQPPFFPSDRHWALERLGVDRMTTAYRWASLQHAGVAFVASSDSPVESPDTLGGIRLLQSRDGVGSDEGATVEALSELSALRSYAQAAHRLTAESGRRGSIESGKEADLTFVQNYGNSEKERVIGTMVAGRLIYASEELAELFVNLH
jgi:predicted amidohydrolase YtcJ